ncbi:hypothetical protein [Sphingomonas sp. BK235]|uniref:hypothetical protein n=1 Tax=Sphingomonas sp. BK235 TaxID=2512131 RepID=UPI0010461054|nr:hypothetical protein [Sphingomonas sp. BK235]TCP33278.1 hypothetical protein EV292_106220 [Sphingomonas sp. BK235]
MSRPDANASAALDRQIIRPVFFVYLDVLGDPLRACTAGRSLLVNGTGDADLDGFVFDGLDATIVDIGPVRAKDGGSDAVSAKLSGLLTLDNELLNLIGGAANWQSRTARLWRMIRDEDGIQRGAIQHYYTGYMTALSIEGDPAVGQTINLIIEGYLAAYSQASGRTYMDQALYDPADLSAKAAIAIANGNSGSPLTSNTAITFSSGSAMSAAAIRQLL